MKNVTQKTALTSAVLAIALSSSAVHAASETGTARVFIQETIVISETTQVDFGGIPNADGTCSMSNAGVLSGTCSGTGTTGSFGVTGSANQAVTVSATAGSAVDGVTFTPSLITPASTTLDGAGQATVDVTGALTLSGATAGQKTLNYTLTVNYD